MDEMELILLFGCGYLAVRFLARWYGAFLSIWIPQRARVARAVFISVPIAAAFIILFTLRVLASFDVVNDFIYILMYAFGGFAIVYLGMYLMTWAFDLSWRDDIVSLNNPAAMMPVLGGYIAIMLIYAGANTGDGPGWWCVLFAGALGLGAWFLLCYIVHAWTGVFERITVDRDIASGIRMGCYMIAIGIVLARASGGDWTSFGQTLVEFADGWPVLLFTLVEILAERNGARKAPQSAYMDGGSTLVASLVGLLYIASAILIVLLLPPLPMSPVYSLLTGVVV